MMSTFNKTNELTSTFTSGTKPPSLIDVSCLYTTTEALLIDMRLLSKASPLNKGFRAVGAYSSIYYA